jgi:hypothetical protein
VRAFLPLLAGALFFLGFDMYYRNEDRTTVTSWS